MRTLAESNRRRLGVMGVLLTLLVVGVGQSFTSVPVLAATPVYYAQFTDTGGIGVGDRVEIAGVNVGLVRSIKIRGTHVSIGFSLPNRTVGTATHALIRTDTLLGRKNLELEPRGADRLRPGGLLPVKQTTTPYQIYDAFADASKAATGWDIDTVRTSLKVLSETFEQTAPHLSAALDGVTRFSATLGRRDDQIKQLLTNAGKVAHVFGDRSDQINGLLVNAGTLLAAFKQRSQALSILLSNVSAASTQVSGLVDDNIELSHMLGQLDTVSGELARRKGELGEVLVLLSKFTAALSEAVASGPYFKVMVANLLPYQVLQPWVDAAFKKRGLHPEEFWRNAGLPEFRYPDPNGIRLPNGAPPPAPTVLEGTPEHPGPAVVPGTPCSYAPAAGVFPTPGNPLPCAGLDQDQGPFGPHGGLGPYPALPDVLTSPPNPDGLPASPGISIGGLPNQVPPDVPGTPNPLPPDAPPGARTEPPGPVAGPADGNPGAAHWGTPGAGPLAPPTGPVGTGPGDQLPVPFIPPGAGGNSQPGGGGGSLHGNGR
ncbi:MAG TPA: MCE family protein [Mycobacterium sp.]|nr:MCE family protein [Mycobacterium sp.]